MWNLFETETGTDELFKEPDMIRSENCEIDSMGYEKALHSQADGQDYNNLVQASCR